MTETMTGILVTTPGGPEVLHPGPCPRPSVGPTEVLVAVAAAGVNRPDLLQRMGKYPPSPGASELLGLEVAGTVVDVGSEVERWRPGDRVCALLAGGGYAEFAAVPQEQCLPVPHGLSLIEAAAVPETFFTVWTNVVERGRLTSGEALLVHGGASGIGTTAIQLARVFGARVFATAGTPEKCAACEALGAVRAIDYRREDFVTVIRDATSARGVDVILDMVGGDYTPRNLDILALEGRLVQIAFLRGPKVEIDWNVVMRRRLTLTGSTLRPRSPAEKGRIAEALERRVWPHLEAGRIRPVIHRTFPLTAAADAHRALEAGDHVGKIVLIVRAE
jgi:putative PIG3 family NAD(P)H quinone oxidoreductase